MNEKGARINTSERENDVSIHPRAAARGISFIAKVFTQRRPLLCFMRAWNLPVDCYVGESIPINNKTFERRWCLAMRRKWALGNLAAGAKRRGVAFVNLIYLRTSCHRSANKLDENAEGSSEKNKQKVPRRATRLLYS
jgi:hypothetical protein